MAAEVTHQEPVTQKTLSQVRVMNGQKRERWSKQEQQAHDSMVGCRVSHVPKTGMRWGRVMGALSVVLLALHCGGDGKGLFLGRLRPRK